MQEVHLFSCRCIWRVGMRVNDDLFYTIHYQTRIHISKRQRRFVVVVVVVDAAEINERIARHIIKISIHFVSCTCIHLYFKNRRRLHGDTWGQAHEMLQSKSIISPCGLKANEQQSTTKEDLQSVSCPKAHCDPYIWIDRLNHKWERWCAEE